ncbi:imidazole glycerol phosphate synthase subunit HisH [Hallella bergensis]|uniref:imidazole glycerol phosphate synthase subunit HisH n=1 Tax=Hallella bergensis TaxID=242750 RepID=UPI0023F4CDAB|nr:imidazole glycerol phosphate synthase subunit HisH [Hallella bergensis]
MEVAIINYNAGNIFSVVHALRRLGVEPEITDDPEKLQKADRVLFPGQGNAQTTMHHLRTHGLDQVIRDLRQPVLGICVGQQLMCRHSEEGDVDCMGIFPVDVKRFRPTRHEEKVPAMGWNALRSPKGALFNGIQESDYVYFVHSFYVTICDFTTAETDYILPYSAALHKDNFWATQFHPEKSGKVGEQIIANFLNMK